MLRIENADTAEHNQENAVNVVGPVLCALPGRTTDDPKLSGFERIRVLAGTRLAKITGVAELRERHFCNYEVNEEFRAQFESAGLRVAALAENGETRVVELQDHPFFLATLFQPQLTSRSSGTAHPVIVAWLRAAGYFSEAGCSRTVFSTTDSTLSRE